MIRLDLTDRLGRVWDLSDHGMSPVVLAGVRGLGRPQIVPHRRAGSPAVHGRRWAGWRAAEREIVLPLSFVHPSDVAAHVRDWAAAVVPAQQGQAPCLLTATLPDTTRWQLALWLIADDGLVLDHDPTLTGELDVTTIWEADALWSGPVWSGRWQADAAPASWILTTGGVAALGSSHALSSASALNAGDVPVWPVWTIEGPCTSVSVGVDGSTVTLAAALTAGQSVTIDTDPEHGQTAIRDDGTDLTPQLTAVGFAPVQPGTSSLDITMAGTGAVAMSYRPRRLAIL